MYLGLDYKKINILLINPNNPKIKSECIQCTDDVDNDGLDFVGLVRLFWLSALKRTRRPLNGRCSNH